MKREDGTPIPLIDMGTLTELLKSPYSLETRVEQTAYSQAMVLRVALGLSCKDASLLFIVDDCFAGAVALATARQLCYAGAETSLFFLRPLDESGLCHRLFAAMSPFVLDTLKTPQDVTQRLQSFHAVLCGTHSLPQDSAHGKDTSMLYGLSQQINESQTPAHTVLCPPGVDGDSGNAGKAALICATTCTPGLPLQGLAPAHDYCGRVYCGDVGISPAQYADFGYEGVPFFTEQPVIQIFF